MKIAVLGTGVMGASLARFFIRTSHSVVLASREVRKAELLAAALQRSGDACPSAEAAPIEKAVRLSDLAVIATRWENTRDALERAGPFEGRVLIDATNPETVNGRGLAIGHTSSGAEEIARLAPDARVVKAFNHSYAELLDRGPDFERGSASVLFCGDDPAAKATVAGLISAGGFHPVDAGPLASARYLEPLALLFVELVRGQNRGPSEIALSILTREQERNGMPPVTRPATPSV
ncbi:MAG: NAD(P)-binding domain-containing protein [Acidobacteriota bacterium]